MKHDPGSFAEALPCPAELEPKSWPTNPDAHSVDSVDGLTGLADRSRFERSLADRLERPGRLIALMLIDVDYFKQVNDGHGHPVGDQMLRQVAGRLRAGLRANDLAARLGGDEFAVVFESLPDAAALQLRAEALVRRLCQPMTLAGHRIPCSVSAGLACAGARPATVETLLIDADAALYIAKAEGRGQLVIFDEKLRADSIRKAESKARGRLAIENRRIFPYYQPMVDLQTGEAIGLEALMRWKAQGGTMESPDACPQLMDDPLVAQAAIDGMLSRVLRDLRRWRDCGVASPVAVNLTDSDLRRVGFAEWFLKRVQASHIPFDLVEVEVSETVPLSRNPAQLAAVLNKLNSAGVRVSLDDFGTGNAALLHLRNLPISQIKIDKIFIDGIETEPDDRAIVSAVVTLAKGLSIQVIAEGIETERQFQILRRMGCQGGQGFLFGRPKPASKIVYQVRDSRAGRMLAPA